MASREHWSEIHYRLNSTSDYFEQLRKASSSREIRRSWETYIKEFCTSVELLVNVAKARNTTKPWGHQLWRAFQHDDPGLVYIREARNKSTHGLEPFAKFTAPHVTIDTVVPNFVQLGPNSSITFSESSTIYVNGIKIQPFSVSTDEFSKVTKVEGAISGMIKEHQASIILVPIPIERNRKKETITVPSSIGGKPFSADHPLNLAEASYEYLFEKVVELKGLPAHPHDQD